MINYYTDFSELPANSSSIQGHDYQRLSAGDNNDTLRSFYTRKVSAGCTDSDDTSDDEFILYVDDDRKHILKSS